MKTLLLCVGIVLIHATHATLLIKGPTEPVLEGELITLECLYSDSDRNISEVYFEVYYEYTETWGPFWFGYWCMRMREIPRITTNPFHFTASVQTSDRLFRCASDADNGTEPDYSQPLSFKVHFMRELSLTREGFARYLEVPEELKVRLGDEVELKCSAYASEEPSFSWHKEGSDWILPSSTLTLTKISERDEGQYTCMAEHSIASLNKKRTISITVLPEDAPWYESSNGRLILMTSAAAAALVVFIISMSVFLCRRAKRAKTSKGPIDDHSQKKPIYKASVESIPSISGDKQPLV